MLYYVIVYYVLFFILYYVVSFYVMLCYVLLYYIILYYIIFHYITLCDIVCCFYIIYILLFYIIPYYICRDLPRPCNSLSAKTVTSAVTVCGAPPLGNISHRLATVPGRKPASQLQQLQLYLYNLICTFILNVICIHFMHTCSFISCIHESKTYIIYIYIFVFQIHTFLRSSNQNGPLDWSWPWQLTLHISPNSFSYRGFLFHIFKYRGWGLIPFHARIILPSHKAIKGL